MKIGGGHLDRDLRIKILYAVFAKMKFIEIHSKIYLIQDILLIFFSPFPF